MNVTRFSSMWLLVASCFAAPLRSSPQTPAHGGDLIPAMKRAPAPDFTVTDVYGHQVTLSSYKGRVLLLDFWATTCGGCKLELPWYGEFGGKYKSAGLSLVGLDMYGESPDVVKPFMQRWKMDYPVAIGTDVLGDRFGLKEMPLTLLIDRQGRVAVSHAGVVDKGTFESDVRALLQE